VTAIRDELTIISRRGTAEDPKKIALFSLTPHGEVCQSLMVICVVPRQVMPWQSGLFDIRLNHRILKF